jgi:hypothetical protein
VGCHGRRRSASKTVKYAQPAPTNDTTSSSISVTKPKVKDPVKAFTRAVIVSQAKGEVTAAELEWAKREGLEVISPTALGRKLTDMGFERVKRGGRMLYRGVALTAGNRVN